MIDRSYIFIFRSTSLAYAQER